MSRRKHEDVSKGDESPEENSKEKPPTKIAGKRSRSHTDDQGNWRPQEKKVRGGSASDEAFKVGSKKSKSLTKKLSKRSRSSASDDRRSYERKTYEGESDEEVTKKNKSPSRKQSRRSRSSTSDDGRPHEKRGCSNETPVEKKPPSRRKRRHSDSDDQEDEKLPKKKTNINVSEGAERKRQHSDSDGQEGEKLPKKKTNIEVSEGAERKRQHSDSDGQEGEKLPKKKTHVHVPEAASNKSKDDKSRGKVKLIPGMLGRKKIWSESDDRDEGIGQAEKKSHARDDENAEHLSTPIEKKVPSAKVLGKRAHSNSDDKGNSRPPEKRTAHEDIHNSRDDQTPERFSTPVETTGSKVRPPPKVVKRSWSSTESHEEGRPPVEKRAKLESGMTKTTLASSRRRDSKPSESVGKGTENGSRSGTKKRAKSPEIFAHNLKVLRKKSAMRRKKLTKELGSNDLSSVLCSRREGDEVRRLLYQINPNKHRFSHETSRRQDRKRRTAEDNEVAEILGEDGSTYQDSNIFLKGTQSANPHNDYSQHFVDTGQRPQNFIRDVGKDVRFLEYPKLAELIRLKDEQIKSRATQPMYLKCDIKPFDLLSLGTKFDVIHITPPLEEYQRRASGITFTWTPWDWEDIMNLKIEDVAAQRSFVFVWCGSGEGLDLGRECLKKWGFRRCEDIVWVKTNVKNPGKTQHQDQKAILQNTKEHCLMGIKGTVRRNQDGHFIHANIDLDVIVTEEHELGNTEKPDEIFDVIEHFCLGRRRLHLFGTDATIRPGWLTIGPDLTSSNYSKEKYLSFFEGADGYLLGHSDEIESMRPKTPPMKSRGGGRGGGPSRGGGPPMRGGMGRGGGPPSMGRGGMPGRTF